MDHPAPLHHIERAPAGEAAGAIVLLHGRGADENDLFPLFDFLDPDKRLLGLCPRGPLALPPGGAHWYVVRRVGYPDPATFLPTFRAASQWLDETLGDIPPERTIIAGFSQGAVMTYSLAFGPGRPRPAGVIALSGFMPVVDGFDLDLSELDGYPVAIGHGIYDPVITVDFGRRARDTVTEAGAEVFYRESPIDHTIDPGFLNELRTWVTNLIP